MLRCAVQCSAAAGASVHTRARGCGQRGPARHGRSRRRGVGHGTPAAAARTCGGARSTGTRVSAGGSTEGPSSDRGRRSVCGSVSARSAATWEGGQERAGGRCRSTRRRRRVARRAAMDRGRAASKQTRELTGQAGSKGRQGRAGQGRAGQGRAGASAHLRRLLHLVHAPRHILQRLVLGSQESEHGQGVGGRRRRRVWREQQPVAGGQVLEALREREEGRRGAWWSGGGSRGREWSNSCWLQETPSPKRPKAWRGDQNAPHRQGVCTPCSQPRTWCALARLARCPRWRSSSSATSHVTDRSSAASAPNASWLASNTSTWKEGVGSR